MDWPTFISAAADGAAAVALVVFLFVALARGWLVTRREAESYRENEQIWREAYNAKAESDNITKEQFTELLESSRTTRAFIQSFMRVAGR